MSECGFTYEHYLDTIKKFKVPILRHDVDMSLDKACQMARLERIHDIPALYMILPSSTYYNAYSAESISKMKEILALGHDIGLHYDLSIYDDDYADKIFTEAVMLGQVLDRDIKYVVAHNPVMGKAGNDKLYKKLEEYGLIDMNTLDMKYISDSGHNWREGCMCNHTNHDEIQINIHPEWWNVIDSSWDECYDICEFKLTTSLENNINNGRVNIGRYHDKLGIY